MRFKVDENLPRETCDLLNHAGHDAISVGEQALERRRRRASLSALPGRATRADHARRRFRQRRAYDPTSSCRGHRAQAGTAGQASGCSPPWRALCRSWSMSRWRSVCGSSRRLGSGFAGRVTPAAAILRVARRAALFERLRIGGPQLIKLLAGVAETSARRPCRSKSRPARPHPPRYGPYSPPWPPRSAPEACGSRPSSPDLHPRPFLDHAGDRGEVGLRPEPRPGDRQNSRTAAPTTIGTPSVSASSTHKRTSL